MILQAFQNSEAEKLMKRYGPAIEQSNPPPDIEQNREVSLIQLEEKAGQTSQEIKKLLGK